MQWWPYTRVCHMCVVLCCCVVVGVYLRLGPVVLMLSQSVLVGGHRWFCLCFVLVFLGSDSPRTCVLVLSVCRFRLFVQQHALTICHPLMCVSSRLWPLALMGRTKGFGEYFSCSFNLQVNLLTFCFLSCFFFIILNLPPLTDLCFFVL